MGDGLPDGVAYHDFGGGERLATRGPPAYGEPTDGDWRVWDPGRSKLGAMLAAGMDTGPSAGDRPTPSSSRRGRSGTSSTWRRPATTCSRC
jgi:fibrillarin-like pre-rRNA processing protein